MHILRHINTKLSHIIISIVHKVTLMYTSFGYVCEKNKSISQTHYHHRETNSDVYIKQLSIIVRTYLYISNIYSIMTSLSIFQYVRHVTLQRMTLLVAGQRARL